MLLKRDSNTDAFLQILRHFRTTPKEHLRTVASENNKKISWKSHQSQLQLHNKYGWSKFKHWR